MTSIHLDPTKAPAPHLLPGYVPDITLGDLLYSRRNAQDILHNKNIPFWVIDGVEVLDPNEPNICIHYALGERPFKHIEHCSEFVELAWADRMRRAQYYRLERAGDAVLCTHSLRSNAKTHHVWAEATGQIRCSCPDYSNQFILFQRHPFLWNWISQQPRCKHILAAAPVLGRADVLRIAEVNH